MIEPDKMLEQPCGCKLIVQGGEVTLVAHNMSCPVVEESMQAAAEAGKEINMLKPVKDGLPLTYTKVRVRDAHRVKKAKTKKGRKKQR